MSTHARTRNFMSLNGATRAVHSSAHLLDLPPVISPQQAGWDKRKFLAGRARALRAEGMTPSKIAKTLRVKVAQVNKWVGS